MGTEKVPIFLSSPARWNQDTEGKKEKLAAKPPPSRGRRSRTRRKEEPAERRGGKRKQTQTTPLNTKTWRSTDRHKHKKNMMENERPTLDSCIFFFHLPPRTKPRRACKARKPGGSHHAEPSKDTPPTRGVQTSESVGGRHGRLINPTDKTPQPIPM